MRRPYRGGDFEVGYVLLIAFFEVFSASVEYPFDALELGSSFDDMPFLAQARDHENDRE